MTFLKWKSRYKKIYTRIKVTGLIFRNSVNFVSKFQRKERFKLTDLVPRSYCTYHLNNTICSNQLRIKIVLSTTGIKIFIQTIYLGVRINMIGNVLINSLLDFISNHIKL